ncbi:hypothetical protein GCM10010245_82340 [Streptomyces spectabilis]|uniref:Uncharacterized protein n=1 Tax=Streptomyces spectabilis TaxID=68270 RepID=A0A7W8B2S5_STRST|nr:hypothetical protein [Streptomyces spectabilis]MBB5109305.1 hypothetical protein [Streptomyces spectabilis]GGV52338.1 hypothetical protein GCM10010245_82340 [Streptomyces spectabilis]
MSRERPFFVAGQWSGPEVEVWEVREAPQNADEYTAVLEEWTADAADVFGSVEVIFASCATEAVREARRQAAETADRIGRDLRSPSRDAQPKPHGSRAVRRREVPHRYR